MAESAEQVSFGHAHAFDLDEPGEFLGSGGFGEVRKVACAGCPEVNAFCPLPWDPNEDVAHMNPITAAFRPQVDS